MEPSLEPIRNYHRPLAPAEFNWETWRPYRKFQNRLWLHVLLFGLTTLTTTAAGALHYLDFTVASGLLDVQTLGDRAVWPALFVSGLWYSVTILIILTCHELGHYLACRYYDVDASLPFFLPAPLLTGTLGAFIRIREPIGTKRALFDIGIAGPIAGFLVAVPALFLGLSMSTLVELPQEGTGGWIGEPLLFKAVLYLVWGPRPAGFDVAMHPMAWAAWFGLFATALNLLPFGQLDGGHITYSVLGRKSSYVSLATAGAMIPLAMLSVTWIVWGAIMLVMLRLFGRHHPSTPDEDVPLDRRRLVLAAGAVLIFAVCFTPIIFTTIEYTPH